MLNDLVKLRKRLGIPRWKVALYLRISIAQYIRIEHQSKSRVTGKPYSISVVDANQLYKYFVQAGKKKGIDVSDINIYKLLTK